MILYIPAAFPSPLDLSELSWGKHQLREAQPPHADGTQATFGPGHSHACPWRKDDFSGLPPKAEDPCYCYCWFFPCSSNRRIRYHQRPRPCVCKSTVKAYLKRDPHQASHSLNDVSSCPPLCAMKRPGLLQILETHWPREPRVPRKLVYPVSQQTRL